MSSSDGRNLRLSAEQYSRRLWDWTKLNDSFDRGIRVGDIDGFVEVGGRFLLIEGKPPGGRLPKGQRYALRRLAQVEKFTVIVIEGRPPDNIQAWRVIGKKTKHEGSYEDFAAFVREWFKYADSQL